MRSDRHHYRKCRRPPHGGSLRAGVRSRRQKPQHRRQPRGCAALGRRRIKEYTALVEETRRHAIDRLVANAAAMGANAVVMMRFDSGEIGQTMSEVVAYGTAVRIEPQ
jgi:hypothetical protein